jgi:hypothetical protein
VPKKAYGVMPMQCCVWVLPLVLTFGLSPLACGGATTPVAKEAHAFAAPAAAAAPASPAAQRVIDACEGSFDANRNDCNAFLKSVASALQVSLPADANADALVDYMSNLPSGWTKLPDGDGARAEQEAAAGRFVVAGLKGSEQASPQSHGHVCVVVSGSLDANGYPPGYWGSITPGLARKNASLRKAWNGDDIDNVHYFSRPLP